MIDLIKDGHDVFLLIGLEQGTTNPKYKLPLTPSELEAIANNFSEAFAIDIGEGVKPAWAVGSIQLTEAKDHPHGWTNPNMRTILHYKEQGWHMIPPEIAAIGELARKLL